jgi:ATPase subunit of ABC transporter with duplicated ATPase domains
LEDVAVRWKEGPLFEGFFYEFSPGERLGVIGRNGTGEIL